MTWAQRLKRVLGMDVTTCIHCGVAVRIVASIEDAAAIRAIVAHFETYGALEQARYRPAPRPSSTQVVPLCDRRLAGRLPGKRV